LLYRQQKPAEQYHGNWIGQYKAAAALRLSALGTSEPASLAETESLVASMSGRVSRARVRGVRRRMVVSGSFIFLDVGV
jgi:hypothetical protein